MTLDELINQRIDDAFFYQAAGKVRPKPKPAPPQVDKGEV